MKRIVFLIILVSSIARAQTKYEKLVGNYMEAQANVNHFSGSVLIMKKGKVLLRQAYGLADREWNVPNTADSRFRIGSLTKQFTAACILQLVEQKKLDLTDKLSRFFPGYPKGDSVTIHMLLNHTSGIANYTDIRAFENVAPLPYSKDSIVRFFSDQPYNFSPGSRWSYSNSGYFLLGMILEKVSGQSYGSYLQDHIFSRLSMNNTGEDRLDTILPMRSHGYSKMDNKYVNAQVISMEWPFSAGVLFSTVDDLYKWDRALYGTSILSEQSKQKMFSPGMRNYGYGVIIDSVEGHLRIWHNGGIPGFLSHITRLVNDDICIIVLSNNESNADLIDAGLTNILLDQAVIIPYEHKEIKIDPSILKNYTGKYTAGLTLEFIIKENKLYRHRDGTADILLIPESNTKFFYADGSDRQIEFEVDASGKVVKTWFINNGLKGEMKRID